jgi:glycosyltransferase involved in cell wall biosynthesis
MKILQVNCVYKNGSTGKIVSDVHSELLRQGIESIVCYGRGEKTDEEFVYKTCGELYSKINHFIANVTGVMYGGCRLSTKKLIHIIEKEKPDIVHLQCINGYFVNIYRLVEWLKANHIRTVVTLHAEFMYTGGCGHSIDCNQWSDHTGCRYSQKCPRWRAETKSWFFDRTGTMWKRMKKAFDGFDSGMVVTSVSPWLMERAKRSVILEGKDHKVVLNGLDENVFHVYEDNGLKNKHDLTDEKIIFHVTPSFNLQLDHIKGGYYVNELAKRFIGQRVKFIIAGSLSDKIQVPNNVILLGKILDQKLLARYYSMADLTLLTSRRETFSMVTAESLSCGTPVVGFQAGGPEQIAIEQYSRFVKHGDLDALEGTMRDMLTHSFDKAVVSERALKKYGKDIMCEQYIKIYRELYQPDNNKTKS